LGSLSSQGYKKIQIIISDGGSTDSTLEIAKKYKAKILNNKLKTAESGKSLGLKNAKGAYVLLLDSDNILPNKYWITKMLAPLLANKEIIGSEPWKFTYRKNSGFIERYSALMGANDPYAWFTGNVDKINHLNNTWPFPELIEQNNKDFLLLKLSKRNKIPTIGANGTIFRADFLKKFNNGDYLFDIDIINRAIQEKSFLFAKTKIGIIHTYSESSVSKFIRKQSRRITDFYFYKKNRKTNWDTKTSLENLKFLIYSLLIIPSLITSIKGFVKKKDFAWFFHPIACWITSIIYLYQTVKYKFKILQNNDRKSWSQ